MPARGVRTAPASSPLPRTRRRGFGMPKPARPLTILKGHTYGARYGSWSPDGSRIFTASGDGTARIWAASHNYADYLRGRIRARNRLCLDATFYEDYFGDRRFQRKKPRLDRTWKQKCGDNIYFRGPAGEWIQHENAQFHEDERIQKQDTKNAKVFISNHFFYFGENAIAIPARLLACS